MPMRTEIPDRDPCEPQPMADLMPLVLARYRLLPDESVADPQPDAKAGGRAYAAPMGTSFAAPNGLPCW